MNVPAPRPVRPLRHVRSGAWQTADGRFDLCLDETGGQIGIGGYGASGASPRRRWFAYPVEGAIPGADPALPVFFPHGQRAFLTLRALAARLGELEEVDVEPTD